MHAFSVTGLKEFQGTVVHTHDFRHPARYEDKRVVVIGIGNSGGDVSVELSRIASQVPNHISFTHIVLWVFLCSRITDNCETRYGVTQNALLN